MFGVELMNDPHDLKIGTNGWDDFCQQAIDAMRSIVEDHDLQGPGHVGELGAPKHAEWSEVLGRLPARGERGEPPAHAA